MFFLRLMLLLGALSLAIASTHGDDLPAGPAGSTSELVPYGEMAELYSTDQGALSYFRLTKNSSWMYGHIIVMTLCWAIALPVCKLYCILAVFRA
jgi:hypothetical protein